MSERTIIVKPGEIITIIGEAVSNTKNTSPIEVIVKNDKNHKSSLEARNNYSDPETAGGAKKSKKNRTRKNNQAGGKKGPNGYMKFAAEVRPQILKEHPELKSDVTKVAKKIGEKWRALTDAEKAKY